jgi:DinB superfamily
MDRTLIEKYVAAATVPAGAIRGLSAQELNSFPVPGTWSIQQVIFHLMDSDLIASDRVKRVIAEESPPLLAYDETAFSKKLYYEELDPALACEIFRLNRQMTGAILRKLPDAAFARAGMHSERGRETLEDLVRIYINHVDRHMKFVKEKRRVLGKPLD